MEYCHDLSLTSGALMLAANKFLNEGDYLCHGPLLEDIETKPEFWEHYVKITHRTVPRRILDKPNFFTCAC